mgnify:FL=1
MVAEILEAFTYTIVLEDVEGGRRGYRYPSLYLESLEVNVEEIARLVIAHHEDVFDRIKGYIHEKHSEMVTTKDPLLPNTLTGCNGRITDVEVNIEVEQVETVVEAEKDVEIEH